MQESVNQLQHRFETISRERMQGLPFFNDQLTVETLGFQEIDQGYLGALITPWFINVILLFKQQPEQANAGDRIKHKLPASVDEFMVGDDEELGRYDFISLASPTQKYKLQQQARDFAQQKLDQLLNKDAQPTYQEAPIHFAGEKTVDESRRNFLSGKNRG